MVFSSNIFLFFFLSIFLIAYFITPQKFKNYTLLLLSIVFYAYGAPDFVFLLVGVCVINYFIVRAIGRYTDVARNVSTKITTSVYSYDYMFGFYKTTDEAFVDRDAKRTEKMIEETIERIKSALEWYEAAKQHAETTRINLGKMLCSAAIYAIELDKETQQQ